MSALWPITVSLFSQTERQRVARGSRKNSLSLAVLITLSLALGRVSGSKQGQGLLIVSHLLNTGKER